MPMVAQTLVDRCVVGEADAWRELHMELHPVVVSFLRRLGVPPSEADDLGQDVFLELFRHLRKFEGRSDIKTWVYRLCVTQAGRLRRASWFARTFPWLPSATRNEEPQPTAGDSLPEDDMRCRIQEALARMKPLHRDVMVLYEFEGLSGEQIAEVLACPVATVWRRLHHARREFTTLVKEREWVT